MEVALDPETEPRCRKDIGDKKKTNFMYGVEAISSL